MFVSILRPSDWERLYGALCFSMKYSELQYLIVQSIIQAWIKQSIIIRRMFLADTFSLFHSLLKRDAIKYKYTNFMIWKELVNSLNRTKQTSKKLPECPNSPKDLTGMRGGKSMAAL